MAVNIVVPDADWSTQVVTLGDSVFVIELKYKARNKRWYMTLRDTDNNILLAEKKCVPTELLTGLYDIEGLYGDIYVERVYGNSAYPSRDNFGIGKEFELRYFTEEEINWLF